MCVCVFKYVCVFPLAAACGQNVGFQGFQTTCVGHSERLCLVMYIFAVCNLEAAGSAWTTSSHGLPDAAVPGVEELPQELPR